MSREKQTEVEEITDVLDKCTYDNKLKDEMALMLYNAGCRKSTDLAEEIFAEIERRILFSPPAKYELAEIKKKYTEEGK